MYQIEKIRNLAIIAHIDHGKTTLLDGLLRQSSIFRENQEVPERVMDSFDQEKERGITIYAKHTTIPYKDYQINLIDTPGHADFSAEVERVLGMVQGVLLLVDAKEGPMPQTRFVLSRALQRGLKILVVLNKIDKPHADPDKVLNETFDLFVELGADDNQLDFPIIYASGLSGFAIENIEDKPVDLAPMYEMILKEIPFPVGSVEDPFLMQAATVYYDEYLGRGACGRILSGKISKGESITRTDAKNKVTQHKVSKLEGHLGLERIEKTEAGAGDIVIVYGIEDVMLGDSLCNPNRVVALPPLEIGEPTVSIELCVNSSPFAGKDGKHVTMNKLRERLLQEKKANLSLRIEEIPERDDAMRVCGRGELHLAVLLESLRREGYECAISKPQVIYKEINDEKCEPFEQTHIEVPEKFSGTVIEDLSKRKGEMRSLHTNEQGITTIEFLMPTRGLMGYRSEFLIKTSGLGILTSIFESFRPCVGGISHRFKGVMISSCNGKTSGYACFQLQERGKLFVKPGDEVYEGMIVGEHARENDLVVNVTKAKQLTNVRAAGSDENIILTPPMVLTLEQAIDFIQDDELLEVTPHFLRMRKKELSESLRKRKK
jgi:GTP-binding protein